MGLDVGEDLYFFVYIVGERGWFLLLLLWWVVKIGGVVVENDNLFGFVVVGGVVLVIEIMGKIMGFSVVVGVMGNECNC